MDIILASASPRRKELMSLLPFEFTVVTNPAKEVISPLLSPQENAMQLAYEKVKAVQAEYPNSCVIGCDTIVSLDGEILGKPESAEHACKMLRMLSSREHMVYTGVYLSNKAGNIQFYEGTKVKFRTLDEQEVESYVKTGEPMDKAGAYGIQGKAAIFVERITGDYFNVVGLPVQRLYKSLLELGFEPYWKS